MQYFSAAIPAIALAIHPFVLPFQRTFLKGESLQNKRLVELAIKSISFGLSTSTAIGFIEPVISNTIRRTLPSVSSGHLKIAFLFAHIISPLIGECLYKRVQTFVKNF